MVFFFTSATGLRFYMGRDKYENEDLIKCSPHPPLPTPVSANRGGQLQ
jgi:hypothetical protein